MRKSYFINILSAHVNFGSPKNIWNIWEKKYCKSSSIPLWPYHLIRNTYINQIIIIAKIIIWLNNSFHCAMFVYIAVGMGLWVCQANIFIWNFWMGKFFTNFLKYQMKSSRLQGETKHLRLLPELHPSLFTISNGKLLHGNSGKIDDPVIHSRFSNYNPRGIKWVKDLWILLSVHISSQYPAYSQRDRKWVFGDAALILSE